MALTTTIVTQFDDSLQVEWLDLWQRSLNQTLFMHPKYQGLWWRHEGKGELKIFVVRDESNQLVGLLPLFEDNQLLRIVGALDLSDYLDVVVDPESQETVFQELTNYLKSQMNLSTVKLECLAQNSATLSYFTQLGKNQLEVEKTKQTLSPVITLPKTWDEYFNSLDPDQQKKLSRLMRSISDEDEISYRLVEKSEDMTAAIESFITLHKASSSDKASFWTAERESFFKEIAKELSKENLVKIYFLDVNRDPAAAMFIFDFQNQFLVYNSGFNAYRYGHMGVSNALILHTIRQAIELGKNRYDFMRGDEPYKYQFGAQAEAVFDLKISC
jgi:CelD/BcsL family acetyltransferase involved in cellulose biosynthesis